MEVEGTRKEFSPLYNSEAELLRKELLSTLICDYHRSKVCDYQEVERVMQKFSSKFTIIPELLKNFSSWLHKFKNNVDIKFLYRDYLARQYRWSYFLDQRSDLLYCFYDPSVKHFLMVEKSKQYLRFPISSLTDHYKYIQKCSASPLPKELEEQYRESLKRYQKIKDSESSNTEWLKLIKEVNDINFAIQNIECRIGKNPENKEMWKLYIQFLKNSKLIDLMCHTYSRYCCLFTDDLEMREEFKNEIQNLDDIFLQWKLEMIKIEKNFGTLENAISLYQKYFPSFKNEITGENFELQFQEMWEESRKERVNPLTKYTACDDDLDVLVRKSEKCLFKNDAIHQTFSLPTTAINFMLKNAKYDHLKKLYETSKYFYARLRSPLCYKIMIGITPTTVTFQQSLYIPTKEDATLEDIKKCHVNEMIHIQKTSPSILSSIIQTKILKCEISTLSLFKQKIFFEDFLKLVSNVEKFTAHASYVLNEESQNISIPEIIAKMPSVKIAKFVCLIHYSPFPSNIDMSKMERKLEKFDYDNIALLDNLTTFCEFLSASLTSRAIADINLSSQYFDECEIAKKCIAEMFASWRTDESFKPRVKISMITSVYRF